MHCINHMYIYKTSLRHFSSHCESLYNPVLLAAVDVYICINIYHAIECNSHFKINRTRQIICDIPDPKNINRIQTRL